MAGFSSNEYSTTACYTPTKPHFIQPCLHGFTHRLRIPRLFFKNYLFGYKSEHVTLRSSLSHKTWKVKISGLQLRNGWKEFVVAHGVQLGDVVVFRHEGNLVFYVTVFDSTACEREYPPYVCVEEEDSSSDSDEKHEKGPSCRPTKTEKPTSKDKASSSRLKEASRHECSSFVVTVRAYHLRKKLVRLPTTFVKENGLENYVGEIKLMDNHGEISSAKLIKEKDRDRYLIGRGWGHFCIRNRVKEGNLLKIGVIQHSNNNKPLLKIQHLVDI